MTYRMALRWAEGMGMEARDAHWLLSEVARMDLSQYLLHGDDTMEPEQVKCFEGMVRRFSAGEPAQYILGYWDFCGLTLKVDRRALIPRPETEVLVEKALAHMPEDAALRVADVGCGTGCIGLALLRARRRLRMTLLDLSEKALDLARENAALLRMKPDFVRADMNRPLPGGPYDWICSNPPYITTEDCGGLDASVREFEPMSALDGGTDGLDFYRALAGRARDSLAPGGYMILEIGRGMADGVMEIMKDLVWVGTYPDLAGIDRVMLFQKG